MENLDDNFAAIGLELLKANAKPYHKTDLVRIGKRWFEQNYGTISASICNSQAVRNIHKIDEKHADVSNLMAAICDVLATLSLGVAPTTVALLAIRLGLPRMCKDFWVEIQDG